MIKSRTYAINAQDGHATKNQNNFVKREFFYEAPSVLCHTTELVLQSPKIPQKCIEVTYTADQFVYMYNDIKDESHLDDWFSAIEKIEFDPDWSFHEASCSKVNFYQALVESCKKTSWGLLLKQLDYAISLYENDIKEAGFSSPEVKPPQPSPQSIINLLYLIPSFTTRNPNISIDADTGYCIATFEAKRQGVMSIFVTDKKEVNYFLIDKGRDIVKNSGTTKVRNRRDFSQFSNILLILDGK